MPKVTLTFTETNPMPDSLKAFKTSDTTADVWVNTTQDAVAAELNPSLVANRDAIKAEKDSFKLKYDTLVSTSSADDVATAKRIQALEAKVTNPIPDADQKILDAVKSVKGEITPEFLKEAVEKYPQITAQLAQVETAKVNETLFKASGYKNRTVFDSVYNNPALNPNFDSVVMKDEKDASGQSVKVPYIKVKTAVEGKHELTVADYAKASPEWNHFTPALTAGQDNQNTFNAFEQNNSFQQHSTAPKNGQPTNKFLAAVDSHKQAQDKAKAEAATK